MSDNHEQHDRVKKMIVESLRLKVAPQEIANDAPLFQTLGLDSIDGLEMAVAIEKEFGVSVTTQDVERKALQSVNSIVDFILQSKKA